jgi:hypothetical protein
MEVDEEASETDKIEALRAEEKEEDERLRKVENVSEKSLCEVSVPTKHELFPFQKKVVDFADKVGGKAVLALDMGMGKTICAIGYGAYKRYGKVLIISPPSIKENWKREIEKFTGVKANIIEHENKGGWEIIGYPNIEKFKKYLYKQQYDLIVVDECFPYNTKIFTDKGYLKIGDIVENDLDVSVLSCNLLNNELEYKKIVGKKAVKNKKLIKVTHNEGYFYCTPEHKIFTEEGYKKAETLKNRERLRILRQEVLDSEKRESNCKILFKKLFCKMAKQQTRDASNRKKGEKRKNRNYLWMVREKIQSVATPKKKEVLFKKMLGVFQNFKKRMERESFKKNERKSGVLEREEKTGVFFKNEKMESDEECRNKEEGCRKIKKEQASPSRREREKNAYSSRETFKGITKKIFRLARRVCYKNKRNQEYLWENAELLQDRHCEQEKTNSNRSRWLFTWNFNKKKTRQKEGLFFETVRVESVESQEQGSNGESQSSGGQCLYDIEVAGNHNYFAEDILVSNCHLIKNRKARRSKNVLHLLKKTKDALFLSGTPILNRPVEIYNVFNYVKPTPFWGRDGFALKYCEAKETRFGWDFNGASNLEELRKELSFMLRWRKEEVLDQLPDKTHNTLYTEMGNWTNYNQILNNYRAWLKENDLNQAAVYAEALTKVNYLKQEVAFQKLNQVHQILTEFLEADKNVLVFSQYKTLINELALSYQDKAVVLTGDTPDKERPQLVDKFQDDPNCRIFFSTIKAGGVGLTLTKADTVVFTDLDWTPAMHQQAEDRAWRYGQKNNVNVYYLIAPQTIEEEIWDRLNLKQGIVDKLVESKQVDIKDLLKNI